MKVLAFSPAAEADLDAIWDYSDDHRGAEQADRYIDDIVAVCRALATGAKRGRVVDVRPGYLKHAAGSHMIYFRVMADRVEVIRVLHVRQDIGRHL